MRCVLARDRSRPGTPHLLIRPRTATSCAVALCRPVRPPRISSYDHSAWGETVASRRISSRSPAEKLGASGARVENANRGTRKTQLLGGRMTVQRRLLSLVGAAALASAFMAVAIA